MSLINILLYLITVLIWGTTWFVIKLQLGSVPESWSVAWRFFIAAIILALWLGVRGRFKDFPTGKNLGLVALQGLMLFCLNYWLFYLASNHLTTGLVAIVFSLITIMNIGNQYLFFKTPVDPRALLASLIGIVGLLLVFYPEFYKVSSNDRLVYAVLLCVLATWFASVGNILSVRNSKAGLPIMRTNMIGMFFGALGMVAIAMASGNPPTVDLSPAYLGSLLYLAIFGSVVAFGCYLTLIHRIGADRGAYAGVAFPVVALLISTVFEQYQWSITALAGIILIVVGNVLVLSNPRQS